MLLMVVVCVVIAVSFTTGARAERIVAYCSLVSLCSFVGMRADGRRESGSHYLLRVASCLDVRG
jgi:hypothetical protein